LLLEESTEKANCGFRVPPCLHQDIQDLTVFIYGSVLTALLSIDPDKHFITRRPVYY
jgi:hypothetical protein